MTDKQFINLPAWGEDYPTVYSIRNITNGKIYVGQTANYYNRISTHLSALKAGRHQCKEMQSDYDKGDKFIVGTLYKIEYSLSDESLLAKEWEYINELGAVEYGYNRINKMPEAVSNNNGQYFTHQQVFEKADHDLGISVEELRKDRRLLMRKSCELREMEYRINAETLKLQEKIAKNVDIFMRRTEIKK